MRAIRVELSAVIFALVETETGQQPLIATVDGPEGPDLPTVAFDPDRHRTLELSLREWVGARTGVDLGHVEQLYTFGDPRRAGDSAATDAPHLVSIGYMALTRPQTLQEGPVRWARWSRHFPWEDRRRGQPLIADAIAPGVEAWVAAADHPAIAARRRERLRLCFGLDGPTWAPELALERYELLYGARLVAEAYRDRGLEPPGDVSPLGAPLPLDHRRIVATAIGRLRGKLKYRPVLFELTPPVFTLLELQRAAEAVSGELLHKQNFRRQVERSGLVEPTGTVSPRHGGRPAAQFRYAPEATSERRAARGHARQAAVPEAGA
jgi:hypothetical protein